MAATPVRTMVVDDSMVFRKILSDLLKEIPGIEIVGHAPNGRIAVQKLSTQKPDLLLLACNLPEMSGFEVLAEIREKQIDCGAIMVSGSNADLQKTGVAALTAGAFEFLTRPDGETIEETSRLLRPQLKLAVEAFQERLRIRRMMGLGIRKTSLTAGIPKNTAVSQKNSDSTAAAVRKRQNTGFADLIVIGISTGGPPALAEVLTSIKQPLDIPVIIVQHIPQYFSGPLAAGLREKSGQQVYEVDDGMNLEPGKFFLSPGGAHVKLVKESGNGGYQLRLSDDPPENSCRPSIDYLLKSAVNSFVGNIAVLIMTGMGSDGLSGARLVKKAGGYVMAQNGESCVVYGMPKAIVEAGLADEVLSLNEIPAGIQRIARREAIGSSFSRPSDSDVCRR